MTKQLRRLVSFSLMGAALSALIGCGSLPDLKPFADATSKFQSASASAGESVAGSIPESLTCKEIDSQKETKCASYFRDNWQVRIQVLDAVSNYADSLAQIAQAGESGAASAERVSKAMDTMLSVLKLNPLTDTVKNAATKIYGEVARVRAMRSMSEAVNAADDPLKEIVKAIQADMANMKRIVQLTTEEAKTRISAEDDQIGSSILYTKAERNRLLKSLGKHYQNIRSISITLAVIRAQEVIGEHPPCSNETECAQTLQALDQAVKDDRQRLASVEGDLEKIEKAYAPIQSRLDAADKARKQALSLIAQIDAGLTQWIYIHGVLGEDLRRKLQPNTRQLFAIAQQINQTIEDMRKAS